MSTTNTTTNDPTRRSLAWHDGLAWSIENPSLMAAAIVERAAAKPGDAAGRAPAEALDFLRRSPAEWDDRGPLVAFGLTLRQTRHRFTTGGPTLHTWCAPDAIAFPVLLGAPAVIESQCIATGETMRTDVAPPADAAAGPATTLEAP